MDSRTIADSNIGDGARINQGNVYNYYGQMYVQPASLLPWLAADHNAQCCSGTPPTDSVPQETVQKILTTLYTVPYRERKDRNPERIPGTCEWFVAHELFRQWRESKSSSMLWVSADPGCGKSVLARYLADSEISTTESTTTCYFFFKDVEDQKSAKSALCCILHQLFR